MHIKKIFFLALINFQLSAVMAPWYWVGFPVQINHEYPGNPEPLIGSHYTFIFDTYHYEGGKKYPAGRIMQSNNKVLYWYVMLSAHKKGSDYDKNAALGSIEPEPWFLNMLQFPASTKAISITAIGTQDTWSKIWMEDRDRLRHEPRGERKKWYKK